MFNLSWHGGGSIMCPPCRFFDQCILAGEVIIWSFMTFHQILYGPWDQQNIFGLSSNLSALACLLTPEVYHGYVDSLLNRFNFRSCMNFFLYLCKLGSYCVHYSHFQCVWEVFNPFQVNNLNFRDTPILAGFSIILHKSWHN